jgi:CRP-like cAMP-binding protein
MKYQKLIYPQSQIEELHKIIEHQKPTKTQLDKEYSPVYIKDHVSSKDSTKINDALKKLISFSSKINMFKGMKADEIIEVVQNVKFKKYNKNEYILKKGDANKEIFFILQGELVVTADSVVVAKLKQGEVFGEISSLLHAKSIATVRTGVPIIIISFEITQQTTPHNAKSLLKIYKYITMELSQKLKKANLNYH